MVIEDIRAIDIIQNWPIWIAYCSQTVFMVHIVRAYKVKLQRPSIFTQTILKVKENTTTVNSVLDGEGLFLSDLSMPGGVFLLPEKLTDKYETWSPLQWETSKMLSSRCSSWYLPSSTSLKYRPFRVSWLWQRQSRGQWRLFLGFSDLEAPYGSLACLWKKVTAFLWASSEKTRW